MDKKDLQPIVKAIEDHGREIRELRRAVESTAKKNPDSPPPQVNQIFEAPAPVHPIHLAFMDPNDPRPTCWDHSGIGAKFTITNHPTDVTCKKCLGILEQNQ